MPCTNTGTIHYLWSVWNMMQNARAKVSMNAMYQHRNYTLPVVGMEHDVECQSKGEYECHVQAQELIHYLWSVWNMMQNARAKASMNAMYHYLWSVWNMMQNARAKASMNAMYQHRNLKKVDTTRYNIVTLTFKLKLNFQSFFFKLRSNLCYDYYTQKV